MTTTRGLAVKECPHCGNDFQPLSMLAIYCSLSCKNLAAQKRRRLRDQQERILREQASEAPFEEFLSNAAKNNAS